LGGSRRRPSHFGLSACPVTLAKYGCTRALARAPVPGWQIHRAKAITDAPPIAEVTRVAASDGAGREAD